ncbi:MAG: hypothetical protein IT372_10505 [Polyangiaceae bacterium]|nr:hypothetical protein [Polyangiaceae bacterium]
MRWTEGHVHVAMRKFLSRQGWRLVAGEYPGGSDHQLYPLNVVDPTIACDRSPDPRRHSLGELVPDLVALRDRDLFIGEAKLRYDEGDRVKLALLLGERRSDLLAALRKFARERGVPELLPVETLVMRPALIFMSNADAPPPAPDFTYLRIVSQNDAYFEGALGGAT